MQIFCLMTHCANEARQKYAMKYEASRIKTQSLWIWEIKY